ncbi:MAG: CPBP family intramembrane glutamic endopeptidase [Gemmatimonadota bacterium]
MTPAAPDSGSREPGDSSGGGGGALPEGGEWDLGTGWALAAYVFGLVFLVVAGSLLVPLQGAPGGTVSASALVLQGGLTLVAGLIPAWILLILAHGAPPASLGFHLHRSAVGESLGGILLGIAVTGASVATMAGIGVVRWVDDAGSLSGFLTEGGVALAILALPAAAEEVVFRGYPLQLLSRSWGPGWALAVTSVGFGLLHGANPGITGVALLNLILAGLFLGVVYLKTGSLWWATGAHLGWNWTVGFLVDLPVSGLEMVDTPLWTGVPSGPSWLGGGSFGPEGSVLTAVIVSVSTVVIWRASWLSPGAGVRETGTFGRLLAAVSADGAVEGGREPAVGRERPVEPPAGDGSAEEA